MRPRGGIARRRPTRLAVLALVATLTAAGIATAATIVLTGQRSRPQSGSLPSAFATGPVPSNRYRVDLAPNLMAGAVGSWCSTFEFLTGTRSQSFGGLGCSGRDGPLVAPDGASGLGPGRRWVLFAVLKSDIAAVRISDSKQLLIPVTGRDLPYGWKVAVAIANSTRSISTTGPNGTHMRFYVPPTMTFLNARLQPIRIASHPENTNLPARNVDPRRPPTQRCAITVHAARGLNPVRETILRTPPPRTLNPAEPGYLSCASVEMRFHGSPAVAAILLDAQHPGKRPPPLPNTKRLSGDANVFVGPGAEEVGFIRFGFNETAQLIARRIGNAWLVIQGPHSLTERKTILQALQATT